jgi:hypothetical protein
MTETCRSTHAGTPASPRPKPQSPTHHSPPYPTPPPPPQQIVDLGFDENFHYDNIKLGLMVVACAFAMVAQFYPMPFPESRPLLGVCCISYFLASTIIQLIVSYLEQDAILTTQPHEVSGLQPVLWS